MTVQTNIAGLTDQVLQATVSAYGQEAYVGARLLSSTGLVGTNPNVDRSTETYVGQVRWFKAIEATVNVASLTVATAGTKTTFSSDYLKYVKNVRTVGSGQVNLKTMLAQEDGLKRFGSEIANFRARDEHNSILAILKGVAIAEALNGAGAGSGATGLGGQTFDNDPTDKKYGFYVDLGAKTIVDATAIIQGAARAEGFLKAFGMAYKDYEPEYAYMIASPQTIAALRSANLVDQTKVTEGNVNFSTIFEGKFRLIQTRAQQALSSAELTKINTGAGIDIAGTACTYIVLPGAIALEGLTVELPTEVQRDAAAYNGAGSTEIWSRWGHIIMPAGYDWAGAEDVFPSDAQYAFAKESGTLKALTSVTNGVASTTGTWIRKAHSALNLGILPIFHSPL